MCFIQKFYYACGHFSHKKTRRCNDYDAGRTCSPVEENETLITECSRCVANAY
jgi:hypothetical protein